MEFLYRQESYAIIGAAMEVHKTLGLGFTEYVYQDALEKEFQIRGIPFEREKHMTVTYKGVPLLHDFYADFICYGRIIVELKAVKELTDEHKAQVINYLKVSGMRLGLLLNFGGSSLTYERLLN